MTRKVFFSFHYANDVRRVVQVRNSWVVRLKGEAQPFFDKAQWESVKRSSAEKWIEEQLKGTSVTVVLIGKETYNRPFVRYEIKRSYELGNGILGVYIHNINDPLTSTDSKGLNPLDYLSVEKNGKTILFSSLYKTYDWVRDDGYNNFALWVEAAAKAAGR